MAEYVGPAVAALVGAGQCALIWYGIRVMARAGEQRATREDARHAETIHAEDARHTEVMRVQEARHTETMQVQETRHAETMRVQEARHVETMRVQEARHEEAMRALEALIRGMEAVIERTGGRSETRPGERS